MRAVQLGRPANTTPDAKFNWLTLSMNKVAEASQTTMVRSYAFAKLPSTPDVGEIYCVTDSTVNTWGATIAGTGSYKVLGWWNGSHWTVIGI